MFKDSSIQSNVNNSEKVDELKKMMERNNST